MIRKLIICLIACSVVFTLSRCDDEEVAAPPAATFTVDKNAGLVDETFTFKINEVDADNITLYPYGTAMAKFGTVPVTSFTGGVATVEFKYSQVGTFEAVVVTNNHNKEGTSIANTVSPTVETITITNNGNELTAFSLQYESFDDKGIKYVTLPDSVKGVGTGNITVYMPWGDVRNRFERINEEELIANFSTAPFATVTIGNTAQESGKTENNFSSPVTYTVTPQNGGPSAEYTVTVEVEDVETTTDIKSLTATVKAVNALSVEVERVLPAYADNGIIVVYDTLGSDTLETRFASAAVNYELAGDFAEMTYVNDPIKDPGVLAQGRKLKLDSATRKEFVVEAQDGTTEEYTLYVADAPRLELTLSDLNPIVTSVVPEVGGTTTDFDIVLPVLPQTSKVQDTDVTITLPDDVTLISITVDGVPFASGDPVNYDKGAKFELLVEDSNLDNIQYVVTYNVTWSEQ